MDKAEPIPNLSKPVIESVLNYRGQLLILTEEQIRLALKEATTDALIDELHIRFKTLESKIATTGTTSNRMYSVPQVAEICMVKVSSVQRWVRDKTYPAKKIGRSYYFTEETFNRIQAERGLK